jgi:hypothetical protein
VGRQRTDAHRAVLDRDALQFRDAADVDERRRRRQPELQERNQAVAAGQELCPRMLPEQLARFRH